jgi:hypothetical protein
MAEAGVFRAAPVQTARFWWTPPTSADPNANT